MLALKKIYNARLARRRRNERMKSNLHRLIDDALIGPGGMVRNKMTCYSASTFVLIFMLVWKDSLDI